jgi:hypothetical protein
MKFIKIDSPGKCLRNMYEKIYLEKNNVTVFFFRVLPPSSNEEKKKEVSHGERMIQKIEIAKKYKFLICFENNADETDYVTEKMLTGFLGNIFTSFYIRKKNAEMLQKENLFFFLIVISQLVLSLFTWDLQI